MRLNYLVYFLTLIAAYLVFWLFSLQSAFELAGFISFVASVLHFGIASWLFLFFSKPGRILSIVTGMLLVAWPLEVTVQSLIQQEYSLLPYYLAPVLFTAGTIFLHAKNLKNTFKKGLVTRIILAVFPAGFFLMYVFHVIVQSIGEGALNIAF
jgi:hypothetical protein